MAPVFAMVTARVTRLNAERGFGFVRPDDGSAEMFFHYSALEAGVSFDELHPGMRVQVTPEASTKGPRAGRVVLVED